MNLEKMTPSIRYLAEMTEVLFDKEWAKTAPDLKLYYMYRDIVMNKKEHQIIKKAGLRYDITIMPPVMLGKEFNKTAGHDHPLVPETKITYPEIYQVLSGQALFLIQDSYGDQIKDIYVVEAQKDDIVIIPPNYEHLMINASNKELKNANWICRDFGSNIYKPFRLKQGFSYFAVQGLESEVKWQKNPHYEDVPELKFCQPNHRIEQFKIEKAKEIYSLVNNLKKLDFLIHPQKYKWKT